MEISGNLLILENSGNLKYTQGIFVYHMLFFVTQSKTHNKPTSKFLPYVTMLLGNIFCNSARRVPKDDLLRWVFTSELYRKDCSEGLENLEKLGNFILSNL